MADTALYAIPCEEIDVPEFIDRQKVSGFQIRLLLTCAAVLFLDGFDTQAIGYVAPSIIHDWNVPRAALGPVFSASLFGLMIGALLFGPLADRIGRKWIILVSTAAFGVFSLATMRVNDVNDLMLLRFLTGLGLGGAMPNAVSMTAEFSPMRRRATMVMTMFCGFSIGAAVGGMISAWLIPEFGWRSVFLVGGAAPLLLLPFLAVRLPESVRFLALSGKADRDVADLLRTMFPAAKFAPDVRFSIAEPHTPGIPVVHLLRDRRAVVTLLLWVVFFMSLLDLYFLSNWLPTVLNGLGASVSVAVLLGSLLQVGGVIGALSLGRVMDKFSARALTIIYGVAMVAVALIGLAGQSVPLLAAAIFLTGFCIVGGQTSANAMAATFYPTSLRSTGVGWAFGVGRVGSIVGPMLGGVLLALHWAPDTLFLAASMPAGLAALAAMGLHGAGLRSSSNT
jgi:AAHS family 4-hydroxybenzoate transporter-like MFS transporter